MKTGKSSDESDEEIITVKRYKASFIKSDESDEENNVTQDISPRQNTQCIDNDETLESNMHSFERKDHFSSGVLASQKNELDVGDSSTKLADHGNISFKQLFANKDLYDPEDSEDENQQCGSNILYPEKSSDNYDAEGSNDECNRENNIIKKKSKSLTVRKSAKSKCKKEIDEIHSETQRLVRKSRVSLPYHKPRQRTLAEFLQRRPSVPAKSLRMSSDELKLLAKQVAKRAKEAEEFYKSSSEAEEEKSMPGDIKENSLPKVETHVTSDKNNDKFLEKEQAPMSVMSADTDDNKCEVDEGENVKRESNSALTTSFHPDGESKCTKSNSADLMRKDDNGKFAIDSQELHLQVKDSETFDKILQRDEECKVHAVNSYCYLLEDTQSAMDTEKVLAINGGSDSVVLKRDVMTLCDEIASQDICLRLEDTETCGEIDDRKRDIPNEKGQHISDVVDNARNTEDIGNLSLFEKKTMIGNSIENISAHDNHVLDTQDLYLKITDAEVTNTEQIDSCLMKNKGVGTNIFPNRTLCKSFREEYEKSTPSNEHSTAEAIHINGEIDSQDICLRIENSETLQGECDKVEQSREVYQVKEPTHVRISNFNKVLSPEDKQSSLNTVLKSPIDNFERYEVQKKFFLSAQVRGDKNTLEPVVEANDAFAENKCLHSHENTMSYTFQNSNGNCKTVFDKQEELISSSRKSLFKTFSETEFHLNEKYNNSTVLKNNKTGDSFEKSENFNLILEGEETRVAFEQDDALLLDKTVIHNVNQLEKLESSNNPSEIQKTESENTTNLNEEGKSDKKITSEEQSEEMLKEPHESHLYIRDSALEGKENAIKTIQKLRKSDGNDPKNAQLLRTMSLLEDRLKSTRKSLKLQHSVPQLKGSPGKVIDLDDTPSTSDINFLKQRFLRHSLSKPTAPQKSILEVSVISAEKGSNDEPEVKKEIISIETETENLLGSRAKMRKLKEELQKRIVKSREEEWMKRRLEIQEANSLHEDDERSECGLFDEEIADSANDTETENEEEEGDSEEEEDKVTERKRANCIKKHSCPFLDNEADVSDCGESEVSNDDDDDDDDDDNDNDNDSLSNCTNNAASIAVSDIQENASKTDAIPTSLKRIKTLDPFKSDDDDDDDNDDVDNDCNDDGNDKDNGELDSSLSIPPYQPGGAVSQITDIVGEEPYLNIVPPTIPTQIQKQDTASENIFSQFPQSSESFELEVQNSLNVPDVDETELLDLCSGKFTSQPYDTSQEDCLYSNTELESTSLNKKDNIKSQATIRTTLQQWKVSDSIRKNISEEKNLESMSPEEMKDGLGKSQAHTINRRKLIVSSDEEDEPQYKVQKKSYKLTFSDDEDCEKDEGSEESLLDDEPLQVEYDSEENEVPLKKSSAKEFFEDEAELSESEWGSADEDERGLDDFEGEEGDDENLDQSKMKQQLDKIHMRRILDEDQQEVRRLQELLLEDGEFHSEGGGRQRQFRWKNLNNADDFQLSRKSDNEVSGGEDNEEEDESQWRRKRFERETFLQEHKNSIEKEEELLKESLKLKFKTPVPTTKKNVQMKRGSFLSRSEAALARIAQLTKSTGEVTVLAPTNSRNFVFATLSQDSNEHQKSLKRKASKTDKPAAKRICVGASLLDQIG